MSRIKPGMRCLIVGEIQGCEANIGAEVVVTEWCIGDEPGDGKAWEFIDASRGLVMVDEGKASHGINASSDHRSWPVSAWVLLDRHLVPIRPDAEPESITTDEMLEVSA